MRGAVEEIKERLSIEEVVGSYVKLERAGKNLKARCPFHHEKTASFFVSPERGGYYCFGCGEKGDIFSFVEKMEGTDFRGALKTLAERAGVSLERFRAVGERDKNERLFAVCEAAAQFFEERLTATEKVQKYLAGRGLQKATISAWRIGFAPDDWRALRAALSARGFSDAEMLRAGLIKQSEKASEPFDVFRHRAMFPLFDAAGRVIAFSGRTMGKESETNPKYLNSPETDLFRKSRALYGIQAAKQGIRARGFALLVEGQVDLVLAHQAGYANAVATSGTALTEEHLALLRRFSDNLMLAYDADESGERAALRAARLALAHGLAVKIAVLPGKDPAEVIAKRPADFSHALKESVPVVRFVLERAVRVGRTARERSQRMSEEVFPLVRDTASALERAEWIKEIATKLGVREESVWEELKSQKLKVESQNEEGKPQKLDAASSERFFDEMEWRQEGGDHERLKKDMDARAEEKKAREELSEALDALSRAERGKASEAEKTALLTRIQSLSARIQELTRLLAE